MSDVKIIEDMKLVYEDPMSEHHPMTAAYYVAKAHLEIEHQSTLDQQRDIHSHYMEALWLALGKPLGVEHIEAVKALRVDSDALYAALKDIRLYLEEAGISEPMGIVMQKIRAAIQHHESINAKARGFTYLTPLEPK